MFNVLLVIMWNKHEKLIWTTTYGKHWNTLKHNKTNHLQTTENIKQLWKTMQQPKQTLKHKTKLINKLKHTEKSETNLKHNKTKTKNNETYWTTIKTLKQQNTRTELKNNNNGITNSEQQMKRI